MSTNSVKRVSKQNKQDKLVESAVSRAEYKHPGLLWHKIKRHAERMLSENGKYIAVAHWPMDHHGQLSISMGRADPNAPLETPDLGDRFLFVKKDGTKLRIRVMEVTRMPGRYSSFHVTAKVLS